MTATTKPRGMETRPGKVIVDGMAFLRSSAETGVGAVNQTKVNLLSKILSDGYLWSPDRRAQHNDEVDPKSVTAFI